MPEKDNDPGYTHLEKMERGTCRCTRTLSTPQSPAESVHGPRCSRCRGRSKAGAALALCSKGMYSCPNYFIDYTCVEARDCWSWHTWPYSSRQRSGLSQDLTDKKADSSSTSTHVVSGIAPQSS